MKIPKLCLHRATGQAYCRVAGRCRYLGKHGSEEAGENYRRLVAALLAGQGGPAPATQAMKVGDALDEFEAHCQRRYVMPDGSPSGHLGRVSRALAVVRSLHSRLLLTRLAPEHVEALKAEMVRLKWSRQHINGQLGVARRCWKWLHMRGRITAEQYSRLRAVEGLREGEMGAKDRPPVRPVPDDDFRTVLSRLRRTNPVLASALLVQYLSGMRTSEMLTMTPHQVEWGERFSLYRPRRHKTAGLGKARVIVLTVEAMSEIRARLEGREGDVPVFSPQEAVRLARAVKTRNRPGWRSRPLKGDPRPAREYYTPTSYSQCVARGCDGEGVPRFHPYRLRHSAATKWRRLYGWDVARILLGHSSVRMTSHYVEDDIAAAIRALLGDAGANPA